MSDQPAKRRILVVEDEPDLATLVKVNLEIAGYAVTTAHDGADALVKIRSQVPDLILLDVMMPVLDGWQVLRAVKDDAALMDIPVIMLTALSEEPDLIRGHLQGAVRYVTKPFEVRTLLANVEQGLAEPSAEELLERRKKVRILLQRLAELDSGRTGKNTVRLSKLESPPQRKPVVELPTVDAALLDRLTEKQRYIAEELGRGRSARDLAVEQGVSRSNVYATRKRIARKLEVAPDDVADAVGRMLSNS